MKSKNLITGIVILAVVILVAGVVASSTIFKPPTETPTTNGNTEEDTTGTGEGKLSTNRMDFGGAGEPGFSVLPPLAWAKATSGVPADVDLAIGAIIPEKVEGKADFTPNITFSIGKHEEIGLATLNDYFQNWEDLVRQFYPDTKTLSKNRKKVGDIDVIVYERRLSRDDGLTVAQWHYVFYINETYGLWVTGSAPEVTWNKYKGVMRESIESIEGLEGEKQAQAVTKQELVEFSNKLDGVSIAYPQAWEKAEGYQGSTVLFSAPNGDNMSIYVYDLKDTMGLGEFTQAELSEAQAQLPDLALIESGPSTLGGRGGHRIVYTGDYNNAKFKWMQAWTVDEARAYVLTFTANPTTYARTLQTIQEMVDSFRII